MPTTLRIPKAAVSMREGTLVAWLVADGATVAEGEPIYTLELEKSTMDVESPAAGVLRQTGVASTTYKVGEVIGEIGEAVAAATVTEMRASLQRLVQVVPSLGSAMHSWARATGAGPFFTFPALAFKDYQYRGSDAAPSISVATGYAGEVLLELVELHDDTASPWREAGVGTLLPSLMVENLDAALVAEAAAGHECVTRGTYSFGAGFAFVDARSSIGTLLHIVEKHFVLTQLTGVMRDGSANWDRSSLTATLK
jgi:pyruvate/2-oxoglutarate dehydrogenase complex dihydrolipoamide acyltransferase (E2) component